MKSKISQQKSKSLPKKSITRRPRTKSKKEIKEEPVVSIGMHNLQAPLGSHKKRKLLGRGSSSGHGKTSTRGSKGQTSRSGPGTYLGFEGGQMPLIRKIPKRGFISQFKKIYQIINLQDLNKIKEPTINPQLLEEKGLIKDREKLIKVLGDGEINGPVTIMAHAFSKKAADKITNAGGKVEIINA